MSIRHLSDLLSALARRGWRVVAEVAGDGYRVSGSWENRRNATAGCALIDFDGMDKSGDACLALARSYGCWARGLGGASLYFGKSQKRWTDDLAHFVAALDAL